MSKETDTMVEEWVLKKRQAFEEYKTAKLQEQIDELNKKIKKGKKGFY